MQNGARPYVKRNRLVLNMQDEISLKQLTFIAQLIAIVSFFVITGKGYAAEVDSFTNRHELVDSRFVLNQVVNLWLEEAVAAANKKSIFQDGNEKSVDYCNQERLFDELEEKFTGFVIGKLESFVVGNPDFDVIIVDFENSIYRDFEFTESPTISLTKYLAVLLRVGDVYLGSDKFGHFFTEGYTYYEIYSDVNEYSALQFGDLSESTFYGELATGIFSYADLAANLNGLRFWNSILALKKDPLSVAAVSQPYVQCIDNRWQLTKEFDWMEYVDPSWEESINCSAFEDDILLEKVRKRIAQNSHGQSCPVAVVNLEVLEEKYGDLLHYVYNSSGNKVSKEPLMPKFKLYWLTILERFKMALFFMLEPDKKFS